MEKKIVSTKRVFETKKMQKRVWKVKARRIGYRSVCEICEENCGRRCDSCQINDDVVDLVSYQDWCRKVLMILLCGQKRGVFGLLDNNCISIIYGFCIGQSPTFNPIDLIRLWCDGGRPYHEHCPKLSWYFMQHCRICSECFLAHGPRNAFKGGDQFAASCSVIIIEN